MEFQIDSTFVNELPADENKENHPRQVKDACFSIVSPIKPTQAKLIHFSDDLANTLGLDTDFIHSKDFLDIFSGTKPIPGSTPYAMCYGGHQFGHWAGQLGDGRAINIAEIIAKDKRWTLQLKGAGKTPYSRTADGLAVLRSSIREHLCSEAMHFLGVPTTRSLALMTSGDKVLRDIMYNGNPAYESGAIVTRVAPSFLRFGNYQMLAARKEFHHLKTLCDYTIKYHFPEIKNTSKEAYLLFFRKVMESTIELIVHWQRVGFVHGVMNTDNMSILGLTIDYGPYGWLEGYDPNWTPNTTDNQSKRYRYGQQGVIALWNLYQLANAIIPLVEETEPFQEILDQFEPQYKEKYLQTMKLKLGLTQEEESDLSLIDTLVENLQLVETDMTIFFRNLAEIEGNFVVKDGELPEILVDAFYNKNDITPTVTDKWNNWLENYTQRLLKEKNTQETRKSSMNRVNPKYVLRNYMAQMAIDAAEKGDYGLIDELYTLLKNPYADQPDQEKWFTKRPEWARNKIGCSMLSCSS